MLRPARPADASAIAAIYAHHVLHGTGTFEEVPPDKAEMARRMEAVHARGWPWLVAEADDALLGYAYAGQLRDRVGYRCSCENSVYVRQDRRGGGVGGALLRALMEDARARGFERMFAIIGDAANEASIALHRRHDFVEVGIWRRAGTKFGRLIDVVHMQRELVAE